MRRLHLWLTCSAVLAGSAMVLALVLSDLERMSWVAGGGSFVIGVCALVLAYAVTKVPASRSDLPVAIRAQGKRPVTVHLTTTASRIGARVRGALSGLLCGVGLDTYIVWQSKPERFGERFRSTQAGPWRGL